MDYYKKLQEKYLYDEDTIYYLRKIIPILIRYYGSNVEDIIYSAIMTIDNIFYITTIIPNKYRNNFS